MLWHKSWLDTRWRFLIGLALLTMSAFGIVLFHPDLMQLVPLASTVQGNGAFGRQIREGAELMRDYRGYIWSQWFQQTPTQLGTLFATLLGTGGLVSQPFGGGELFMLSLPASRNRLLGVRAATGLAEWLVLAVVPSLFIPLLSPAVDQTYSVGSALVHGVCLFAAGALFFSMALLLSTIFDDVWRPLLIVLCAAFVSAILGQVARGLSPFTLMSGEVYFRTGSVPWSGLITASAASAAMVYAASVSLARRDF